MEILKNHHLDQKQRVANGIDMETCILTMRKRKYKTQKITI